MERPRHPALVVGLMLALIVGGSAILQRDLAETMSAALVLSVVWAGVVGIAFLIYARPRRLLAPVMAGLAVGAVLAGGSYYWFSVRDSEVDEDVATASATATGADAEQALAAQQAAADKASKPADRNLSLATGEFVGADGHAGEGTATVVELAGGERTLTFTDFEVDPAVQVEVWLTPGPDQTDDRVALGSLKGNVGDQQYEVPADVNLNRYRAVMIYCVPFTVRIAYAELSTA